MECTNSSTVVDYSKISEILQKYNYEKSFLIAILQEVQSLYK